MTNQLPLPELAEGSVIEESAELVKELMKARRFGLHDVNPLDGTTPAQRIAMELGDLFGSLNFYLETHPEIDRAVVDEYAALRKPKLLRSNDPAYVEAWKRSVLERQSTEPRHI